MYLPAKSRDKSSVSGNLTLPKIAVTSVSMLTEATLSNLPPVSARLKFAASIASNVPLETGADGAAKAGQLAETTHACTAEITAGISAGLAVGFKDVPFLVFTVQTADKRTKAEGSPAGPVEQLSLLVPSSCIA